MRKAVLSSYRLIDNFMIVRQCLYFIINRRLNRTRYMIFYLFILAFDVKLIQNKLTYRQSPPLFNELNNYTSFSGDPLTSSLGPLYI